jgi:hypothetical protein
MVAAYLVKSPSEIINHRQREKLRLRPPHGHSLTIDDWIARALASSSSTTQSNNILKRKLTSHKKAHQSPQEGEEMIANRPVCTPIFKR